MDNPQLNKKILNSLLTVWSTKTQMCAFNLKKNTSGLMLMNDDVDAEL